jgi:uncharacterized protein YkwD
MTSRFLPIALALSLALALAADSEAGPLRRRTQPSYQPSFQPSSQSPYQSYSYLPSATPEGEYVTNYLPATTSTPSTSIEAADGSGGDGLDEVNAKRAARGLRPFIRDEGLTQAARACASYRAQYSMFGHTSNDFAFVPSGSSASSAGCAAYPASYGWMSCCTYEGYTYGGAAWVTGRDGKRYMHLFVR